MVSMLKSVVTVRVLAAGCVFGLAMGAASSANAQLFKDAWSASPQNRASIAALMQQVENKDKAAAGALGTLANTTTVLNCAKGEASAEANSSCIIMNNSNGVLNIGQDSEGDQNADNTKTQTQTVNAAPGSADDVLEVLQGNN